MGQRSIEKIMNASASIKCPDNRKAAILGGLTRTLIDLGHFDRVAALNSASDFIASAAKAEPFSMPDASRANWRELAEVVKVWQRVYDPPKAA